MNVLLDKGVISAEELIDRLTQARDAALQSQGGPEAAAALEEILRYLLSAHGKMN